MGMSPDALEAAHLIDRLERLARSGVGVGALNSAQWEALRYLSRANRFSRSPAAVAAYLGSTRGTVSQTLIALEQKGFVARRPSARDKRFVDLDLTAQGVAAVQNDPLRALAEAIEQASGDGGQGLAAALRAVLRRAIARNGHRPFGACFSCRHFRRDTEPGSPTPHRCGLMNEPLTEADSRGLCIEHEAA
ncbi:MAG TPA: MarR family transcriptional regulator [Xanthobacteraceae bacterium]|nr:MarR family transcriptional regulator [Xanthobacteraceae bacterium]